MITVKQRYQLMRLPLQEASTHSVKAAQRTVKQPDVWLSTAKLCECTSTRATPGCTPPQKIYSS